MRGDSLQKKSSRKNGQNFPLNYIKIQTNGRDTSGFFGEFSEQLSDCGLGIRHSNVAFQSAPMRASKFLSITASGYPWQALAPKAEKKKEKNFKNKGVGKNVQCEIGT